jgi:hypothetical protein
MSELTPSEFGDSPTVEVIVFRHGDEIHRELCESAEQAAVIVDQWSEQDGVECQVDDLSVHHGPDEILEPTPDALVEDEYRVDRKSQ